MTRKEAERLTRQQDTLMGLGFTREEADQLRRISMTLQRWYERECNGEIQRDEETEKPYAVYESFTAYQCGGTVRPNPKRYAIADRETGAKKRLAKIIEARNERPRWVPGVGFAMVPGPLSAYIQTDPRGAALYILRPGDVPAGEDVSAYYSRGICVY